MAQQEIKVRICQGEKALTVEDAKKMLGFQSEEESGVDFGDDYFAKLPGYGKVRMTNNKSNRPFRIGIAKRYALEVLRKKWHLNGETIVFDEAGDLQTGQHRLIGLILAEVERLKDKAKWAEYGTRGPVTMEAIVVNGISKKREVGDSLDGGVGRTLGDVIFRRHEFKEGDIKQLSNVLGGAIRLAWIRSGGWAVSDAKHFPRSEALEFLKQHPKLAESVMYVYNLNAGERAIKNHLSLAYAAALHYLMSAAKTNRKKYDQDGTVDLSMKDQADMFWSSFADMEDVTMNKLRNLLKGSGAGSGMQRDELCGIIVKAWNLFVDGKKIDTADIKIGKVKDKASGRQKLAEDPRIGGLDILVEVPEKVKPAKAEKTKVTGKKGPKGKPKGAVKKPAPKGRAKTPSVDLTKKGKRAGDAWDVDDEGWVIESGEDPWYGVITGMSEDGNEATVADAKGDEWQVHTDRLYLKVPKKDAA